MALTPKAQSATDIPPAVGGETEPHSAAPRGLAKKRPPSPPPGILQVTRVAMRAARQLNAGGVSITCGDTKIQLWNIQGDGRGTGGARDRGGSWRNPNSPAADPAAGGQSPRGSDHASSRDLAAQSNATRARKRSGRRTPRSLAWHRRDGSTHAAAAAPAASSAATPPPRAQVTTPSRAQAAQVSSTAPPVLTPTLQCRQVARAAGVEEDIAEAALVATSGDSSAAVSTICAQRDLRLRRNVGGEEGEASSSSQDDNKQQRTSARQARPTSQPTSAHAGDKPKTIPKGKGTAKPSRKGVAPGE